MTAHVNSSCVGCGLCTGICGGVFTMTDEGVAAARDEIFPEQEAQVQEAAESCPVGAIEITP
ncbi:MAG: ferredoxin [Lawsonibacter sp.]|jgi:ferredoxin